LQYLIFCSRIEKTEYFQILYFLIVFKKKLCTTHVNYEEVPMNKPYNIQNTNICNGIFHISFFKALLINEGETTRDETSHFLNYWDHSMFQRNILKYIFATVFYSNKLQVNISSVNHQQFNIFPHLSSKLNALLL
jgi:hypothetical protein